MRNERLGRVGKLSTWGLGGMMALLPACGGSTALSGSADWDSALDAAAASVESAIGTIDSSAKVYVQWQRPDVDVDHFVLAANADGVPEELLTVTGDETSGTIQLLRSATSYIVSLKACLDSSCSESLAGGETTAVTAEETWQIHGTDSGFESATHIVADGNTKASTIVYGEGAPLGYEGLIQLYYDPSTAGQKGIKLATLSGAKEGDPSSVSQFSAVDGVGLLRKDDGMPGTNVGPLTFQVVPLSEDMGGKVRLFFEGTLEGSSTAQLYSVDSVDGYEGRDFHTGSESLCPHDEITPTGACPTTEVFGFSGGGNEAFREVRQAKLVFPRLDDWRWDGASGTPMVVTLHHSDSFSHCSDTYFNLAYLVFDGSSWEALSGDDGCPKSWAGVQAPLPVHVGGPRYKLYFNNNVSSGGSGPLSSGPKPIKLMYGDARMTGDSTSLDFDDWDGSSAAREVRFVWPNGEELSEEDESHLDDYEVYAPTGTADFLVMYSNMSCEGGACGPPFLGMATLLNP